MDGFAQMGAGSMVFVFLAVGAVALFSMISVAVWSGARQKEREAYYRNETVRRLTESAGAGADGAIALLREEDRLQMRRARGVDAEAETVEQDQVMRRQIGRCGQADRPRRRAIPSSLIALGCAGPAACPQVSRALQGCRLSRVPRHRRRPRRGGRPPRTTAA